MNKYKIEDLENKLIECKNKKIEEININEIDNLSNINIDRKKKGNDRILDFINKVSNPYMFNICGKIVKFEFSNENFLQLKIVLPISLVEFINKF